MVKYAYDAFGNCKVLLDTAGLSTVNPIRYRGYYYDHETGLYYLNARYYNPEWRRFISTAQIGALNPNNVNGFNLYSYANNNPIRSIYSSSSVGRSTRVGMVSYLYASTGSVNLGCHGTISNSSNILGALGTLSTAFGYFDQWSGFLSGGLDAGLGYWGPEGFGFQFLGKYSSVLKKFGIGMTIVGSALSWGGSIYNNFTNPNYTTGEAIGASFIDAAYYTGKGFGTYWLGGKVGELAVTAGIAAGSAAVGATIFGTTIGFLGAFAIGGGVAVLVGIAGSVAIYYLGEGADWLYEKIKEEIFE